METFLNKYNRIALLLLQADEKYDYRYDPDHKVKPRGGGWEKTESGWSYGKYEKKESPHMKTEDPKIQLKIREGLDNFYKLTSQVQEYYMHIPDELHNKMQSFNPANDITKDKGWMDFFDRCNISGEKQIKNAIKDKLTVFQQSVSLSQKADIAKWFANKAKAKKETEILQSTKMDIFPPELYKYLPESMGFRIEHNKIVIEDSLANEEKTIQVKMAVMEKLMSEKDTIEKDLERDIKSPDEHTRLCALLSKIGLLSGIRPAKEGNKARVYPKKGEPKQKTKQYQDTYGATTLLKSHVTELRNNFVKFEFPGKKGTPNIVDISDAEIAQHISNLVNKKQNKDYVFTTSSGKRITDGDVNDYLQKYDIVYTDFRKYNSTLEVYSELKKNTQEIYSKIASIKEEQEEKLKEKVVAIITEQLQNAYENARKKLNHKDVLVTVNSYVNPMVIMNWLSSGNLAESFEEAIRFNGDLKLGFNIKALVANAQKKIENLKKSSIEDDLKNFLAIEVVNKKEDIFSKLENSLEEVYKSIIIE